MKTFKKLIALVMAIGMLTVNCTSYAAVTGNRIPILTPTRLIGEFDVSPMAVDDVQSLKNGALFHETGVGAHYYVYSGQSTVYSEAFANIKLPTSMNYANGTRHAFISLGIAGTGVAIDLGLINTGNGWKPVYNEVANGTGYGEIMHNYVAPSSATNAKIVVKPVSTTKVHMYIQFLNSSGQNVGTAFDQDITLQHSSFTSSGGIISCRYYRFASLVPNNGQDNQTDGSRMTGGQFINLGLYNRNTSTYDTWGVPTARVTNAWMVSPDHISVTCGNNYDTFNITHT